MPDITFLAQRRLDEARDNHRATWRGIWIGGPAALLAITIFTFAIFSMNAEGVTKAMRDAWMGILWATVLIGIWPTGWFMASIPALEYSKKQIRRREWDLADAFDGEEPTELYPARKGEGW